VGILPSQLSQAPKTPGPISPTAILAQIDKILTVVNSFFPPKPSLIADEDRNRSVGGPNRGSLLGIAAFDQTIIMIKENIPTEFNPRKYIYFLGQNSRGK
jgi:hypothetical protein